MKITDEIKDELRKRCGRENFNHCLRLLTVQLQHNPFLDCLPERSRAIEIDGLIDRSIEFARAKRISSFAATIPEDLLDDPDYLYGCSIIKALTDGNKHQFFRQDRWLMMTNEDREAWMRKGIEMVKAAYERLGIDGGAYFYQDGGRINYIGWQNDYKRIIQEADK